jgi:DNA-directed RNA polymerase alpha subunit
MTPSSIITGVPVERLLLSPRSYNSLIRAGIDTVEQLRQVRDLKSIRGIHSVGAEEIRAKLLAFSLPQPRP